MIDNEIKQKENCMGCCACVNICPIECIKMEKDAEGFLYPKVDYDICIKCGKCVNVCPIINKKPYKNTPVAYACINRDEFVRLKSSSGGLFTLLAEHVIENGGVVFGAAFNKNFNLEHYFVEKKEDIDPMRGSKYLQSNINHSYKRAKEFLQSGRTVLFSGTPCQIAGLQSYLGKPYNNLISVDIVCHGVPSPDVWKKYIKYQEIKSGSKIEKVSFRSKAVGWKLFSVSLIFTNSSEYRQTLDRDLFMRAFLKDVCLRPSCYACKFKILHSQSNLTLGDFWGIENILPEMDDDKGTSLVFINNDIGMEMLRKINTKLDFKEVSINDAVTYNQAAINSVAMNPNRIKFFRDLYRVDFDKLVNKYCSDPFLIKIKRKTRSLIRQVLIKIIKYKKKVIV